MAVNPESGPRARRMAEATTSPIFDRRLTSSATAADRIVDGIAVPSAGSATVTIDGRSIALTNLDRVLYPETGFTKAESIAYHLAIAGTLLSHLRDRALTVGRFPGGVDGRGFAQTEIPGRPPWIRSTPIMLAKGEEKRFTLADDRASLVWLAQMGSIELHSFLAPATDLERPSCVVLDLDPTPPAGLLDAARVSLLVRDALATRGLVGFAKTSGSVGIHVVVPLDGDVTYADTRAVATALAQQLATSHPDHVSARLERAGRAGKVLVDARQNSRRLTMVAAYSLRSTPRPFVSTPVTWEELEAAVRDESVASLVFEPGNVLGRVERHGDLFAPVLRLRQQLPAEAVDRSEK